jgi:hypothetical protein
VDLVHSLGGEPVAAGVGIPGVMHEGQVLKVPNLERWHDGVDLLTLLSAAGFRAGQNGPVKINVVVRNVTGLTVRAAG